jgi:hypothetical protein
MLPKEYQQMISIAAESGEIGRIDNTIELVKRLAPQYFFKVDKDGRDDDPTLINRVFYHRPFSFSWSGTYITDKKIPRNDYEY